jgi:subtilisin family serine protease
MIKLDHDSAAAYAGGVQGLAATSPLVTGRALTGKSSAERAYADYQADRERAIRADLRAAVPGIELGESFRTVYGGLSAVIPANAVEAALAVDGVAAVQPNRLRQPLTDSSPEFVNAPPLYQELGGAANAGKGVIYGNLDTGVWPEHPSFADTGVTGAPPPRADGQPRECNFGDNPLTPATDVFACQNKLIGGAHMSDDYDLQFGDDVYAGTARDANGHGTHTTSTSAGNIVDNVTVLGADQAPIQGLAPGAWVIEYKVCGPQGCLDSDSTRAVQRAILDGVDVINFSISGGTSPYTDPVELAFLDAYAAGVFVSTSAGNDGPGASTANHVSPWVTTVAASTQTREFATDLNLTAGNGDTFSAEGASITQGVGSATPIVLSSAAPYSNALCDAPAAPGTFTGKVVACQRGGNARVDKGFNVLQGGAVGMVLYNPTLADVETDNHWLPTVHLPDGTDFVAFMNGHSGVTASWADAAPRDGEGDVMATFSSRGPAGPVIKPDLTAPGVQILAGHTPTPASITEGPPGQYFQAIAGTSMSSPHVAGAAILLEARHPDWTPGQIKSALMTSAITDVVNENETTPADPFDLGAGRIDLGSSTQVPFTLDETAEDFFALSGDARTAVHLNLPSINAPVMPGRLTTTRTFTNVTDRAVSVKTTTQRPAGSSITVTPKNFAIPRGGSKTVLITITTEGANGQQQFGQIDFRAGSRALHMPVAWVPTQGDVGLTQSCDPTEIARTQFTDCTVTATNNSFDEQTVDLRTFLNKPLRIASANGATVLGPKQAAALDVVLTPNELGVPSVDPGSLAGFIPLEPFGIQPIAIGDEEIINFNVPPYVYGGQSFTQLGVDSNGYTVVGPATAQDNNCCNLPPGADPSLPNNMLAPFWTDLDGTGADGIRIATLTDGVDTWIVIEHDVNVFGTSSNRHFQTWIGINGVEDITFAYDPDALLADPAGQDFLVGAENADGEGDMVAVLPTEDLRVTSSDPTPGGSYSYELRLRGTSVGIGEVSTEMTGDLLPGVTIVKTPVRVTRR